MGHKNFWKRLWWFLTIPITMTIHIPGMRGYQSGDIVPARSSIRDGNGYIDLGIVCFWFQEWTRGWWTPVLDGPRIGRIVLLALLVAMGSCYAAPAFAHELDPPPVNTHAVSCPDARWFVWETRTTASWEMPHHPNRYNVELWTVIDGAWIRWNEVPSGRRGMSMDGVPTDGQIEFRIRNRRTGQTRVMPDGNHLVAMCSFNPPPDGSAWIWIGDRFVLRPVVVPGGTNLVGGGDE